MNGQQENCTQSNFIIIFSLYLRHSASFLKHFEMINTIEKDDNIITEEEAAQYDRQIRLWGLDAQKRFELC